LNTLDFPQLSSIEKIEQGFESFGYICSTQIATAVFLAFQLRKPILVEGPPRGGKNRTGEDNSTAPEPAINPSAITRDWTRPKLFMSGNTVSSYFTPRF